MRKSFLLGTKTIEELHYISNSDAKKLCLYLDIDLDIFYDKYSNMELSYQICEKYDYKYEFIEKVYGLCVYFNPYGLRKRIIMKSDSKNSIYSPIFFHELGHFLEGYFFNNSKEEALIFMKLKEKLFVNFFEDKLNNKAINESSEYIAHILGLFFVLRLDFISKKTNYFYSYCNYYKLSSLDGAGMGDILFITLVIENENLLNMLRKVSFILSSFDYEYIDFLKNVLHQLYSSLKLDFSPFENYFDGKINEYKSSQSTSLNNSILKFLQVKGVHNL